MISFTVRFRFSPEDRPEVRSLLERLVAASRQEPGCMNYVAHAVDGDPDTIVLYEQYRDADALEAHRASDHFQQYALDGLYRKMRERTLETLLEIA
jgi:quinol monooxygenase YgiN